MNSLTEDGPNDLCEELIKSEGVEVNDNPLSEDENLNWEKWVPDPVDSDQSMY